MAAEGSNWTPEQVQVALAAFPDLKELLGDPALKMTYDEFCAVARAVSAAVAPLEQARQRRTVEEVAFSTVPSVGYAEPKKHQDLAEVTAMTEVFRKICIPEIFTKILREVSGKDRLNVRLVCRDAERSVASADLYLKGRSFLHSSIDLWGVSSAPSHIYCEITVFDKLQLCFGLYEQLTMTRSIDEAGLQELLRMRELIGKRIYAIRVCLENVNFNKVPIDFVEKVLDGCFFDELEVTIREEEYNVNVINFLANFGDQKKIRLLFFNVLPDIEALLSLNRLKHLCMIKDRIEIGSEMPRTMDSLTDDMFLELVKKGHTYLQLSTTVTSEHTIIAAKKILEGFPDRHDVGVGVQADASVRFMLLMGYRMEEWDIHEEGNQKMTLNMDTEDENGPGAPWDGNFTLQSDKFQIRVTRHSGHCSFEMSNYIKYEMS